MSNRCIPRHKPPYVTGLPIDDYRGCCFTTKAKLEKAHAYLESAEKLFEAGVPAEHYHTVCAQREQ
jgi:hypothetical protein